MEMTKRPIFKNRLLFRSIKQILSERKCQHPVVQYSSSPLFSVWPLSRTSIAYFQKQKLLLIGCQEPYRVHFYNSIECFDTSFNFFHSNAKVSCKKLKKSCSRMTFLHCIIICFKNYILMLLILLTYSTVIFIYKSWMPCQSKMNLCWSILY